MKKPILFIAASLLFLVSCQGEQKRVQSPVPGGDEPGGYKKEDVLGKVMPAWEEGFLDIHFINTTSGEAAFIIMPDGTQFLVDAAGSQVATGAVNSTTNTQIRQRWDPTKTNTLYGEFISDYIRKCMVWTGNDKIDYVLLTHLHNDHFGGASGLPKSKLGGNYTQQSLPYIMDEFPIGLLMDRGYPDYMYPFDNQKLASNKDNIVNYVNAVKWHVANKGLKAEQFKVGSASQIKLVKNPSKYPTCKVRNLACNGEIWTGSNENTIKTFPDTAAITYANPASIASADNCPPENITSACFLLSYGKSLWFEMKPYGVGVTTVCPAAIATPLYNLKPSLMKLGVKTGIIHTPEWLVRKALRASKHGRRVIRPSVMNFYLPGMIALMPAPLESLAWKKLKK